MYMRKMFDLCYCLLCVGHSGSRFPGLCHGLAPWRLKPAASWGWRLNGPLSLGVEVGSLSVGLSGCLKRPLVAHIQFLF